MDTTVLHQLTRFRAAPCATPSGASVAAISDGPGDGNIWFSTSVGTVGRITPSGQVREFPLGQFLIGLVAGDDGRLWYSNSADIGRLSTDGQLVDVGNLRGNASTSRSGRTEIFVVDGGDGAICSPSRGAGASDA